jgi:hypothetical protein
MRHMVGRKKHFVPKAKRHGSARRTAPEKYRLPNLRLHA